VQYPSRLPLTTTLLLSKEAASPTGQFIRFASDCLNLSADESMQSFERFLEVSDAATAGWLAAADRGVGGLGLSSVSQHSTPSDPAATINGAAARWSLASVQRGGGSADAARGLGELSISGGRLSFESPSRPSPVAQPSGTGVGLSLSEVYSTPIAAHSKDPPGQTESGGEGGPGKSTSGRFSWTTGELKESGSDNGRAQRVGVQLLGSHARQVQLTNLQADTEAWGSESRGHRAPSPLEGQRAASTLRRLESMGEATKCALLHPVLEYSLP
jgi:hypothetical protein